MFGLIFTEQALGNAKLRCINKIFLKAKDLKSKKISVKLSFIN